MKVEKRKMKKEYIEKNGLVGLNSNSAGKLMNQNFLVKPTI